MKQSACRQRLIDYIREQARPPDKFSHQARLYELARRIARNRRHDDDVIFAAAWLHDLGVFIGHRPKALKALAAWDNVAYAIRRAPEILRRLGFPVRKIPAVVEAIRTHQPACRPTSYEGVVLRDADILEQLGAVSILRTVSKVGRDTRFVRFSDALKVLQRNAEILPQQLQLPAARRLAKPRVNALKAFLKSADSEAVGSEW
jgi:uncharacterized protein